MSWPANPSNGQQVIVNGILYSYNATNYTWDRIGFTASAVTTDEIVISRLTILQRAVLGDVANVSISGGTVGQVLQTDGTGNLSWKTESVITAGGSNTFVQFNDGGTDLGGVANFAFDKTSNTLTVDYGNLVLTTESNNQPNITTVGTLTNLAVTGNLSVGGNSSLTGNVTIGGNVTTTGTISAGAYTSPGSNNQILLNRSGNINGSSNLTFTNSNLLAVTGNITANNVTANTFTGNLTTAAQPNITSVGTLTSLTVTGNVTAGNIKVAFANANIYNAPNSSANTQILLNKAGNIGSYSNLTFDGNLLTVTGNVTATNANLGNAVVANYFTGNLVTGAQPAITSIGTLDSLTVSGNISSGNATLGNLATANYISGVLTSSSQPNITTVGSLANLRVLGNANIDGNLYIGGTTIGAGGITAPSFTGNLNGNVSGVITAPGSDKQMLFNKTGNVGASANITFTEGSGGLNPANLTVVGTIRANSISAVSTLSAPNLTGTLTTADQPNIVSVGTLNSLTLDGGDATFRNTIIDTTDNVQIRGPLIPTGFEEYDIGSAENPWRDLFLAGNTMRLGSTTITATSQGGVLVSGAVTATGGISSDTSAAGTPLATLNATSTGGISTITFPTQTVPPYSVGGKITVAGVTPTGYNGTWTVISSTTSTVSFYETVVGSMAVAGTIVSGGNPPFTVTSTLMVANLNVEYLQGYTPTTIDTANTIVQRDTNSNFQANAITANRLIGIADRANTVTDSSQPNITSVGSLLTLDVLGTITGANLDIADYVDATWVRANIRDSDGYLGSNIVGEVAYANIANSVAGSNVDGQVSNSAIAGSVYSNSQPNITSVGVLNSLHVSGDTDIDGNLYVGGTTVSAGGLSASTISGTLSGTFVSPGSNTEILFNKQGVIGADSDFVYNSLTKSLSITGQLVSVDANLGNLVEANYFKGNGYYLDHIQGLNIEGSVPLANKAGTVTSSSQPNITSTGTLTTLHVSGDALIDGDLTVGGTTISQGGLSTSTLSIEKGVLTVDQPFSINETWSNSLVSFTSFQQEITDTASDPTSLLAEFNVNGVNVFKIDKTGNVTAKDITARYVAGTITYASQPNITSVGTLSSLDVTSNITSGNANLGNAVYGNYFIGDGTYLTGLPRPTELKNENDSSNVKIGLDGNVTISVLGTTNTGIFSGSNLTIKDTIISANANLGDIASANFFVGNGNSLANIRGANVTGFVPNAVYSNTAGTVTTNAQPNITSLGTLASLTVGGTVNPTLGNAVTANFFIGKFTSGANAQPNITSVGTLTTLVTSATVEASLGNSVTSNYFKGNGSYLSSITGSNVTGTVASATIATTAGTVTEAAQPSITSLGTLTGLTVSGTTSTQDITVTGNLTVSGDTITANVTGLVVKDPLIEMGGNLNGVLTTNDGYDRGAVMRYYDSTQTTAFMGWKNSAKEFTFASKATIATNIATIVDLGNIKAGNANIIGNIKAGGSLIGVLDATSNNQPNISNVGTLIGLKVGNSTNFATHGNGTITAGGNITVNSGFFFVGDGSKLTGIDATSIKNGTSNVSIPTSDGDIRVAVNGSTIANIVSTGIIVTGNANASSFNATSQFVSAVATGTAPLKVNSTTRIANLNVAYANVSDFSAVTLQTTGTFYPVFVSGSATANYALAANANISLDIATGQLNATKLNASQITSTATTGTAPLVINSTTQVPNLNAATAGIATNIVGGSTGSIPYQSAANTTTMLSAGTSGQFLQTTGSGLQWGTLNTDRITNGTSNVSIASSGGNITITANAKPNIAVISQNGITVSPVTLTASTSLAPALDILQTWNYPTTAIPVNGIQLNVTDTLSNSQSKLIDLQINGSSRFNVGKNGNVTAVGGFYGEFVGSFANGTSNIGIPVASGNINISANSKENVAVISRNGITIAPVTLTSSTPVLPALDILQTWNWPTDSPAISGIKLNITDVTSNSQSKLIDLQVSGSSKFNVSKAGDIFGNSISVATISSTITASSQPYITSVGTLTGVTSTGVVNLSGTAQVQLGAVANLKISGGTSGQVLSTDGLGGLSWATTPTATFYVGNTALTTSRQSGLQALTGITSIDGSAATLTTSRLINGVAFNGSADITVPLSTTGAITSGSITTTGLANIGTTLTVNGMSTLQGVAEVLTSPTVGTYNLNTSTMFYHSSVTNNFTAAFTNIPGVGAGISRVVTATIAIAQGATAFIPSSVTVNGVAATVKWYGGSVPTGMSGSLDYFSYSIFVVSGSVVQVTGTYAGYI